MNGKAAWVAGATGLVGGFLLQELLAAAEYSQVVALVRRPLGVQDRKLLEKSVEFAHLDAAELPAPDDVFCALGTTIKKAGSQAKFREVDVEYVVALARKAKSAGARQFLLVSSIGADQDSRNFYLRTKGEAESLLREMQFTSLHIFRPSMLLGERIEKRPTEKIGMRLGGWLAPLMVGGLRKYRPVEARTVAQAMVAAARESRTGLHIYEYDSIRELATH